MIQRTQLGRNAHQTRIRALHPDLLLHLHLDQLFSPTTSTTSTTAAAADGAIAPPRKHHPHLIMRVGLTMTPTTTNTTTTTDTADSEAKQTISQVESRRREGGFDILARRRAGLRRRGRRRRIDRQQRPDRQHQTGVLDGKVQGEVGVEGRAEEAAAGRGAGGGGGGGGEPVLGADCAFVRFRVGGGLGAGARAGRPLQAMPGGSQVRGEEMQLAGDEGGRGRVAGPAGDVDQVEGRVEMAG